jgi:hypothetical protein
MGEGAALCADEVGEVTPLTKKRVDVFAMSVVDEEPVGRGVLCFGWELFDQLGASELN